MIPNLDGSIDSTYEQKSKGLHCKVLPEVNLTNRFITE